MIDPDAPSADQPITGPFIHWIKASFIDNHFNDGETICLYLILIKEKEKEMN